MPTIILKKTFKVKPSGFKVAHEKSLSFHGDAVTSALRYNINQRLAAIKYTQGARLYKFVMDDAGHYFSKMNHQCQKNHEEDVICAIIDTMERYGWDFRFQYDTEISSNRWNGSSVTSRELFMFHKSD